MPNIEIISIIEDEKELQFNCEECGKRIIVDIMDCAIINICEHYKVEYDGCGILLRKI